MVPGVSSSSSSLALGKYLVGERLGAVAGVTPKNLGLFRQHLPQKELLALFRAPSLWVLGAGLRFRHRRLIVEDGVESSSRQL